MPFQHVLSRLKQPWFLIPGEYQAMVEIVDVCLKRAAAGASLDPKMEGISFNDLQSRRPLQIDKSRIAHIHIRGVLGRNLAPIENVCGRTDYADVEKEIDRAEEDARAILFEFDTGGGSALGCDQTAQRIGAIKIPKAAFTETICCSGGMYLAAGVDRFFAASGSMIGSIGVVLPWVDASEMMSLMGLKVDMITNDGATLKGMRSEVPLTGDQREHLQGFVNDLATNFHRHVTNYRNVDEEVFLAGSYVAQHGLELGLADEIGGRAEALQYLLTTLSK